MVTELRHAAEVVRGDQHHAAFIAKRTQKLDDGVFGVRGDFHEDYVRFLGPDRRRGPSMRAFNTMLRERGVPETTRNGGKRGFSITLRPDLDGLT